MDLNSAQTVSSRLKLLADHTLCQDALYQELKRLADTVRCAAPLHCSTALGWAGSQSGGWLWGAEVRVLPCFVTR